MIVSKAVIEDVGTMCSYFLYYGNTIGAIG